MAALDRSMDPTQDHGLAETDQQTVALVAEDGQATADQEGRPRSTSHQGEQDDEDGEGLDNGRRILIALGRRAWVLAAP